MALSRKSLKAMGLTDEQVDSIIEMHGETVDGLKEQLKSYKADAEALPGVRKELEKAQADLEAGKKDSWKVKYDALKEEFEDHKAEQAKKETRQSKETAYRALLKDVGISDKRIEAVLRVSDVDGVELDDEGVIKGVDDLKKTIKEEWSDFISTTGTKGADDKKPPANNGGSRNRADIYKKDDKGRYIMSTAERQAALAENFANPGE